ncbi:MULTISPECIES: LysR family transcriptional regulator [Halopseudomonas]|uniref:HTH lysR-type domain-containing protein n=2 Tax=Pseudomonadaceae TaxID=135621 RepID=A0A395QZB4_9PSED|nr:MULTISPECIES: LysR family transcriptional regulator [Halopseudomonas]OWL86503.1 hypothetical protein B7O88_12595 [Halopseudomonas aestusnigri]RGP53227.1 hypothetical protein ASB58_16770 [Halopseudomonas gallaeciensis]SEG53645.1 DNA-binding transcriptional regulator, LysR family [Halopseudomonas aestusnigri]
MNNINTRNLDLNLLVVFVTLWETQNVTRASERLALSQSAVSHALRRLRDRLSDELFVNGRGGLLPTPRAIELIGPVREALAQLDGALKGAAPFAPQYEQRKFRIAAGDIIEFLILPRLVAQIAHEAPNVIVEVLPYPQRNDISSLLENGEIDLIIGAPGPTSASLRQTPIISVPLLTLIWQKEGLTQERLPLNLYLERPHVMIEMHQRGENVIDDALRAQGLARRSGVLVQNFMAMPVIAEQTGYICNLPAQIAHVFAQTFNLSCHTPPLDFPAPELHAYWHNRFDTDQGLAWLLQKIRQSASGP